MKTKVLPDYKNTRRGPCLIIGNGPSLKDVPDDFLYGIPNFACNFFPVFKPEIPIDYLVMIDRASLNSGKIWGSLSPFTLAFCFAKWAGKFPRHDNIVWWANKSDPIRGFMSSDVWGQYFPTSAHAACWIADYMGYDEIFLIGMDGTSQQKALIRTDEEGKSNVPHFYDEHPGKNSMLWDIAWGNIAHFLGEKGKSITNLSSKTAITQIQRRDYLDFYEPDLGVWKWPWRSEYSGRAVLSNAYIHSELVAYVPQDIARALDGVGHVGPGGRPAVYSAGHLDPS